MRGLVWIVFGIFLMIIFIAVIGFVFLIRAQDIQETNSTQLEELYKLDRYYDFSIEKELLRGTQEEFDMLTEDFSSNSYYCEKLKNCIIKSLKDEGAPCKIGDYKFDDFSSFDYTVSSICSSTDLNETIGETERKVCEFSNIASYSHEYYSEDDNTNPFYNFEPFVHDCR
jgi:hypothetical protein